MADIDAVKRKIRSLLEVAKKTSGATASERGTARRLARSLMKANGLTEEDIPERQVDDYNPPPIPPMETIVGVSVNVTSENINVSFDLGSTTIDPEGTTFRF